MYLMTSTIWDLHILERVEARDRSLHWRQTSFTYSVFPHLLSIYTFFFILSFQSYSFVCHSCLYVSFHISVCFIVYIHLLYVFRFCRYGRKGQEWRDKSFKSDIWWEEVEKKKDKGVGRGSKVQGWIWSMREWLQPL